MFCGLNYLTAISMGLIPISSGRGCSPFDTLHSIGSFPSLMCHSVLSGCTYSPCLYLKWRCRALATTKSFPHFLSPRCQYSLVTPPLVQSLWALGYINTRRLRSLVLSVSRNRPYPRSRHGIMALFVLTLTTQRSKKVSR